MLLEVESFALHIDFLAIGFDFKITLLLSFLLCFNFQPLYFSGRFSFLVRLEKFIIC